MGHNEFIPLLVFSTVHDIMVEESLLWSKLLYLMFIIMMVEYLGYFKKVFCALSNGHILFNVVKSDYVKLNSEQSVMKTYGLGTGNTFV